MHICYNHQEEEIFKSPQKSHSINWLWKQNLVYLYKFTYRKSIHKYQITALTSENYWNLYEKNGSLRNGNVVTSQLKISLLSSISYKSFFLYYVTTVKLLEHMMFFVLNLKSHKITLFLWHFATLPSHGRQMVISIALKNGWTR